MIKIMLACSAGMSTSLLVTKMQDAAKEKGKNEYFSVKVKKTGKGASVNEDERIIVKSSGSFDVKI